MFPEGHAKVGILLAIRYYLSSGGALCCLMIQGFYGVHSKNDRNALKVVEMEMIKISREARECRDQKVVLGKYCIMSSSPDI